MNRVVVLARLAKHYSLAELVPWNRFWDSLKVKNSGSDIKIALIVLSFPF
jgi:hypothetical protein